jgi:NADPH:quinone reductase-like Zn-dependent oxidoreductase
MKAIVWTRYGPPEVLQLQEVETPVPEENEVRVKIHATTVTAGDCEVRGLKLPLWLRLPMRAYAGFRRPVRLTILGQEFAGEVESVGKEVTRFAAGDQVFGAPGFSLACYAEYIRLPEAGSDAVLAPMPSNMSYEQAAAVPFGAMEALHFLKKAQIRSGEQVLINGAGGSIGTFGVQLAKYYGAQVTAVDSAGKLDMLRSIGADDVVDFAREDFTNRGVEYDVIFDVIGKSPYAASLRSLKPKGRYLLANPQPSHLMRRLFSSQAGGRKVISGAAVRKTEDLLFLKELIEAGRLETVIDRTYPLEQMVAAHQYVETGQKQGNLIITVG